VAVEQDRSVNIGFSTRRWRQFARLLALMLLLACSSLHAEIDEVLRGSPPDWVSKVDRGSVDDKLLGQISDGTYYLLSDTQVRVEDGLRSTYRRIASKAINSAGVDSLATIEIGFDPAYQTLELNSIDLIRDGHVSARLDSATVRVLQRETELERRIYDGGKSATIFLEDVRVGDVVDYAYTLRGSNPVFQGREFGTVGLQFNVPVARIHARLLTPVGRDIRVVPRNSALEARVVERDGLRSQEWELQDVSPLLPDAGAPGWYDPYPVIQWSEFADWPAVTRWALPLYAIPKTLSPQLRAEVERIRNSESTSEGRLLAALRFVQSEIRYLGVEIGPGSHAPNPPDLVFERRFGDCKDKTLLTLTLLDRLGIEAHPALVNTERQRALSGRMPSPGQFDHVIVRADIDGRKVWLDPTRATQKADLEHLVQPDFDLALVVDPDERGLVSMRQDGSHAPARLVRASFDARAGLEKPVLFSVVTTMERARAESMRYTLATSNFEELQKGYLNFYANYFPGIEIVEPMQVKDDERKNRIVMTEHYRIPEFSSWSEESKKHIAIIPTPDLDELLRGPTSTVRNAPLRLSSSSDLTLVTETLLPEAWPIEPAMTKVEDPAFTFERAIRPKGDRLVITDTFRSLADEVAAADAGRYAGNLARARDEVNYHLFWGDPVASKPASGIDRVNWLLLVIAMMALGFWIWLALRVYRYDPPAHPMSVHSSLSGIGGWLVIPVLGLVATPIAVLVTTSSGMESYAADNWTLLTTFGSDSYHALWAPVLLFELVSQIGIFVFAILLAVLFFRRRSSVPSLYIGFQLISTVQLVLDQLLVHSIPQAVVGAGNTGQAIGSVIGAMIWIGYFMKSERVRNTFVRRLIKGQAAVPAVPQQVFSL
jgi:transglutaminase-like putative cysteine protease